jgi:hypothetical protein
MRCENCNYKIYDYSEDYETCWLGIEGDDNGKSIGCKYQQRTLDKWAKEIEQAEAYEYQRMYEYYKEAGV